MPNRSTHRSVRQFLPAGSRLWQRKVHRYLTSTRNRRLPARVGVDLKDLKAKFSNPVLKDGYLYGFSETYLYASSWYWKLMWRGKKYGYGRILVCGEQLIILGNTGVLSVVDANPENPHEVFPNHCS